MTVADVAASTGLMSLPAYRELIGGLRGAGYSVVGFDDADPSRRDLILRHDIDMCLDRALTLAALEAEMGVRSHYFVLLNTEMYNIGSQHNRQVLRRILDCGHEVGLHFDPSNVEVGDVAGLEAHVARECDILECHLDRKVGMITFHRPAKWLLGFAGRLAGRLHGYQPQFFSDMGYCSDSEGRFRFHHPLSHPAVLEGRGLQLVTHPIWWCADVSEGAIGKLERFLEDRADRLSRELAANCRPYAAHRSVSE